MLKFFLVAHLTYENQWVKLRNKKNIFGFFGTPYCGGFIGPGTLDDDNRRMWMTEENENDDGMRMWMIDENDILNRDKVMLVNGSHSENNGTFQSV